jgi:nucleoside-diphosphate-sugar epimerase
MNRVLITGGAGYKGAPLTAALLDAGFAVTILDNFIYGYEPMLGFASNPKCTIVKKDIRNLEKADVEAFDQIFHLAGISGYPACEANPHSAQVINVTSTQTLVDLLDPEQILFYASTTSIYGRSGEPMDEESLPTPTSLYSVTKFEAEKICMARENSIAFRFATIFGVSPRMRCDLLLNDFVYKAVVDRSLVLFDSSSVRTFLHLRDAIRAYVIAALAPQPYLGKILNIGSNELNYSKLDLAHMIGKKIDFEIVQSSLDDPDRRDFIINFDKIQSLGFNAEISVENGIDELIRLYSWYRPFLAYRTI